MLFRRNGNIETFMPIEMYSVAIRMPFSNYSRYTCVYHCSVSIQYIRTHLIMINVSSTFLIVCARLDQVYNSFLNIFLAGNTLHLA